MATALAFGAEERLPNVQIVMENGTPHYYLPFELTPENTELTVSWKERPRAFGRENKYEFVEGGQFEIFVRREYFPIQIPASCCDSVLVLAMPYTNEELPGGPQNIAEKKKLFDRIGQMKSSGKGSVIVIIDLTPHAKILSQKPLLIELKQRNIYFRMTAGRYIDHAKPTGPTGTDQSSRPPDSNPK